MNIAHTVLFAAFSSLILAPSALAAAPGEEAAGVQPCDAEALNGYYEWAAVVREDPGYFPEDEQALPEEDEVEPADPTAESDEGKEFAPDAEGCADMTLAPYDMFRRPLTDAPRPEAVDLRRQRAPVRDAEYI